MRIGILHFLSINKNSVHKAIIQKLENTIINRGHQVDIFNAVTDASMLRLTGYDYVAVIVPSSALFGSKLPEILPEVLDNCGNISGKKGCALVVKSGFSSWKTSTKLMAAMEKQGMCLDYFDVIENVDHAGYVGKKIG